MTDELVKAVHEAMQAAPFDGDLFRQARAAVGVMQAQLTAAQAERDRYLGIAMAVQLVQQENEALRAKLAESEDQENWLTKQGEELREQLDTALAGRANFRERALTAESEMGAARQKRDRLDRDLSRTISQRDRREGQVTTIAEALGCEREWSNLHDHGDCSLEAAHQFRSQMEVLKREVGVLMDATGRCDSTRCREAHDACGATPRRAEGDSGFPNPATPAAEGERARVAIGAALEREAKAAGVTWAEDGAITSDPSKVTIAVPESLRGASLVTEGREPGKP